MAKSRKEIDRDFRARHPEKRMWYAAQRRARKAGIPFTISVSDIVIPDRCPILGVRLKTDSGGGPGGKDNSPSLDRKVSWKGYVPGNVWVVSRLGNCMKQNANRNQLVKFADWVSRTYG